MAQMRERLCKQLYGPPYAGQVKAFTFVMLGNAASIAAHVVRPALANDYVPAAMGSHGTQGLFAVSWVHYDDFRSTDLPPGSSNADSSKGQFTYNESALFNVVKKARTEETKFLYIPSLYLDKSAPIVSGRDFFGFPKSLGNVTMTGQVPPGSNVDLVTIADEVSAFSPRGSSLLGSSAQPFTVYEAHGGPNANAVMLKPPAGPTAPFAAALDKALEEKVRLPDADLLAPVKEIAKLVAFLGAPLLLLKQTPSAIAPSRPCIKPTSRRRRASRMSEGWPCCSGTQSHCTIATAPLSRPATAAAGCWRAYTSIWTWTSRRFPRRVLSERGVGHFAADAMFSLRHAKMRE